ncbi:MAG: hypothetical protein WKF34_12400 [Pyrinomonadaceae bacterium]
MLARIDALPLADAMQLGVQTKARARMTDDCKKGISKFLGK